MKSFFTAHLGAFAGGTCLIAIDCYIGFGLRHEYYYTCPSHVELLPMLFSEISNQVGINYEMKT